MRGLERLHDEFARLLAFNFTFSEGVQQRIDVDTAFVDQTTFGEVVTSLSDSVRAFRFAVEGLDGDVVVDLALPVVEGLMAAGKSGGTERDRLEYFAERIARDLEKTWAPIVQVAVHSFEMETNRFALKLMPMYELVALEAFEVNARSAEVSFTGLVSLCYPVSAIEKFLPALDEYRLQAVAAAG